MTEQTHADKPEKPPEARGHRELSSLTTESPNAASQGLDTKSALEIARIINQEDAKIAAAVKKALPEIAIVIDTVARSLRDGGRLIYVGAGSSGRISSLDASECPPTFSTAPAQVQYIMAGGPKALASASDVNEDSPEIGTARYRSPAAYTERHSNRCFGERTHSLRRRCGGIRARPWG